ncbi:MAG: dihydropteroate synthase, partial [Candidatus Omnitrophica bacterium]|nr:dihydropteroate synthase [Candidatus Omnitrophota bacterium]
ASRSGSTRPGSQGVPAREEMRRILPVLEGLSKRLSIPVSVDTSKAAVAEAAIGAGASLVNDVTALSDPRMAEVVSRAEVPVILMHMRGTPRTMQKLNHYRRLVPEVVGELKASIARARAAGIPRERILIDPGLGFGKNAEQNFLLLKGLPSLKALDFPVVIGPSRKSFIGAPVAAAAQERVAAPPPAPAERLFGTAAVVALGVYLGADVVRVHDVGAMRQVVEVAEAFRLS